MFTTLSTEAASLKSGDIFLSREAVLGYEWSTLWTVRSVKRTGVQLEVHAESRNDGLVSSLIFLLRDTALVGLVRLVADRGTSDALVC